MNGFGNVRGEDGLGCRQVGDGARHLEDAMVRACREIETRNRLFEQAATSGIGLTVVVHFLGGQVSVGLALAGQLSSAGGGDALAHDMRRFAARQSLQVFGGQGGYLDLQIDAIEQRA